MADLSGGAWGDVFEFDPEEELVPEDLCALCLQVLEHGDLVRPVPRASKLLARYAHDDCVHLQNNATANAGP